MGKGVQGSKFENLPISLGGSIRESTLTGLTLYSGFTDHFIQEPLVDDLGGRDRPLDFLRPPGGNVLAILP